MQIALMNIPNLPTDNLYKFMALSGLAIFLLSIVFPLRQVNDIKLKMIEIETQVEMFKLESEKFGDDVMDALSTKGNLKPKEQAYFRNYLKGLLNREDFEDIAKDWAKGEPILSIQEQALFRSQRNKIMKEVAEVRGQQKRIELLTNQLRTYYIIIRIGGLLGSTISILGFYFWYFLIQRPNDILLRKKIENNKN